MIIVALIKDQPYLVRLLYNKHICDERLLQTHSILKLPGVGGGGATDTGATRIIPIWQVEPLLGSAITV